MEEKQIYTISRQFAIDVINLTKEVKSNFSSFNQLERCGTSVGANIREAQYAISKADFISKLHIALKECNEAEYWIDVLTETSLIEEKVGKKLLHDCGVLRRILIESLKTSKNNNL